MKTWTTSRGIYIRRVLGGRSNVFLITRDNEHILFDTSSQKYRSELVRNLDKLKISRLQALILSHTHFDHVGNAAYIQKKYQAKVLVHRSEVENLRKGYAPIPAGTIFFTRKLVQLFARRLQNRIRYRPCEPDIQIEEIYDLSGFGLKAKLIPTPGHSAGMISMIVDDEIALVGDTLFGIFPGTVFPPFADNIDQLIQSWSILLHTGCQWFLPSHGRPVPRMLLEKCYLKR